MKRKRRPSPIPEPAGEDALALADVLRSIVLGGGHGELTATATALGMTPSALRKRLLREGAGLDEPSIKAVVLIADRKDDNYSDWQIEGANNVGGYVVTNRTKDGQQVTTWRLAPNKPQ